MEELMVEWLTWLRESKGRTPLTVHQYAQKLECLASHLGGQALSCVSASDLEAWLQRPRGGRAHGARGSAATVQKEVAILRGLWSYLQARGHVEQDPTRLLHAPTPHNRNPKPVSDDVWERVWGSVSLPPDGVVVLGLGYLCGLRRAEITGLRPEQVDTRNRMLVGFSRKGGGDDVLDYGQLVSLVHEGLPHLCPDPERFFGALRAATHTGVASGRESVLDWHGTHHGYGSVQAPHGGVDPHLVYKRLWKWQQWARVPHAFTPHQLRHSFVTNLLRIGMPIHLASVMANHSDVSITMRYAKLGGEDLRAFRLKLREGRG